MGTIPHRRTALTGLVTGLTTLALLCWYRGTRVNRARIAWFVGMAVALFPVFPGVRTPGREAEGARSPCPPPGTRRPRPAPGGASAPHVRAGNTDVAALI